MATQWFKALDTFVAETADGGSLTVSKGDPFPADHELVKRDAAARKAGSGTSLFAPLDGGEEPAPARKARGQ